MRPAEYDPSATFVKINTDFATFIETKTYECPRCRYRVPIEKEHVNYKLFYEGQKKVTENIVSNFEKYLNELHVICPDAKIYWETKKQKLYLKIFELQKRLKQWEGGE